MHDHDEYSMRFENEEEEVYLDNGLDISNENSINTYMKHECKNRWLRLHQRFSKERQLREQETRSGAKKLTRQKWMLFDSLTFLERHITQRRSFSNVNFIKLSGSSGVSETSLKTQRSMIPQEDHEIFTNYDSNV
ncbi:hypothetical protein ALC57_04926 [Trachymyrmex cornetzi]|uniref:MADF domain-containing protein n=1 Tax=Trachymyrmex cornetzi TaxID=471704 RepID=A0A151JCI2_9HYME|nr:hypothetical protein ALC57_04926 [Trachymyrmex cornetzi]